MEDVGEVTFRTLMFPLTLGTSEMMIAHQRKQDAALLQQRAAYREWYQGLSPDQQVRVREAEIQAAGQALIGLGLAGGIMRPVPLASPPDNPALRPMLNCWSQAAGSTISTMCR
jgi:hypothetical protein